MEVLQIILTILLVIDSIVMVILVLMQEGKEGGLGAIAGAAGDSYVSRNQSHTPEGKLRRTTAILAAVFMVLALALNVVAGQVA